MEYDDFRRQAFIGVGKGGRRSGPTAAVRAADCSVLTTHYCASDADEDKSFRVASQPASEEAAHWRLEGSRGSDISRIISG